MPPINIKINERIYFGTIFIGGYLGIGYFVMVAAKDVPTWAQATIHDVLIGLGPIIVLIGNSIFKSSKAEQQNADIVAGLAATPPAGDKTSA